MSTFPTLQVLLGVAKHPNTKGDYPSTIPRWVALMNGFGEDTRGGYSEPGFQAQYGLLDDVIG